MWLLALLSVLAAALFNSNVRFKRNIAFVATCVMKRHCHPILIFFLSSDSDCTIHFPTLLKVLPLPVASLIKYDLKIRVQRFQISFKKNCVAAWHVHDVLLYNKNLKDIWFGLHKSQARDFLNSSSFPYLYPMCWRSSLHLSSKFNILSLNNGLKFIVAWK